MTKFVSEAELDFALNFCKTIAPIFHENDAIFNLLQNDFPGYFTSGVTKKVFILDDFDWVIKTDIWMPYCKREVENYEAAVASGLSDYFAATFSFIEIDGIAFYLQEKLQCSDGWGDNWSDEISRTLALAINEEADEDEELYDAVLDEIDSLSDSEIIDMLFHDKRLTDFILLKDINDLHFGNFGKRDGLLVIFDFSGYGNL